MKTLVTFLMAAAMSAGFAETVKLDLAQKKKLDTFFSNFSESAVESFKQGALADGAMLKFALSHLLINTPKSLRKSADGNSVTATSAQVDTATTRYFGKKIASHQQATYTFPNSSGEAFVFSQIDSLDDAGHSTFKATGTIYTTGSGGTPDVHATPAAWKKAGEDVAVAGKFTALVRKESDRYVLLEYTVAKS